MINKQSKRIIESLEALSILEGCPRRELETVNSHTTTVKVLAGSVLCSHGEYGQEAFIIVDGEAEVSLAGKSIARLGVGAVVGEMALLEHGFRSATVIAITPMTVLAMSARDFKSIVRSAPRVTERLLVTLSERLRQTDAAMTTE
jgi:CRP/FNR family transcriptional regulator, cyclic AMP receptor protein